MSLKDYRESILHLIASKLKTSQTSQVHLGTAENKDYIDIQMRTMQPFGGIYFERVM